MLRSFLTYLLIGIYLAIQIAAVPHTHASIGPSSHDHDSGTHFHCGWLSKADLHEHKHNHSDTTDHHHHNPVAAKEAVPTSDQCPHDADAVYLPDAYVTSSAPLPVSDYSNDVVIAESIDNALALAQLSATDLTQHSSGNFFADSDLYLILRALRI
jgi:hypothetical protein